MSAKWVTGDGELTTVGVKWANYLLLAYIILICLMCFLPQEIYPSLKKHDTPGISHYGRIVYMLTPFNSLVNSRKITNIWDFVLILQQNVLNVLLLTPLIFLALWVYPDLRSPKKVIGVSALISLMIEMIQVLLDIAIDANRVFEVDDLWTNTLGGLLAYGLYVWVQRYLAAD